MNIQSAIAAAGVTADRIVKTVEDLPEEAVRRKPAEDKWSIQEVLCHLEEAIPYWIREIRQVASSPGSEWGRGLQHEARLAAVAQAHRHSVQEAIRGAAGLKQQLQEGLGSLSEADFALEAPSRNPRFGTKPMSFIVEHLIVEHLESHLKQIERNLREFKE